MSKKIYTSGNYLYVEDTVNGELITGGVSAFEFVKQNVADDIYEIFKNNILVTKNPINVTDMIDGSDVAYTPTTFKTFIEAFTAFNFGGAASVPTGDVFHGGFADYNDAGTVQNITAAGGEQVLQNDGAGANTNKNFLPFAVTDVWDVITDSFDWSQLKPGDMIDIRLDFQLTTVSVNTEIHVGLHLGTGAGSYVIPFIASANFKDTGAYQINRYNGIYLADANTMDNGGQFKMSTDKDCSIVLAGWYIKIIRKGA